MKSVSQSVRKELSFWGSIEVSMKRVPRFKCPVSGWPFRTEPPLARQALVRLPITDSQSCNRMQVIGPLASVTNIFTRVVGTLLFKIAGSGVGNSLVDAGGHRPAIGETDNAGRAKPRACCDTPQKLVSIRRP